MLWMREREIVYFEFWLVHQVQKTSAHTTQAPFHILVKGVLGTLGVAASMANIVSKEAVKERLQHGVRIVVIDEGFDLLLGYDMLAFIVLKGHLVWDSKGNHAPGLGASDALGGEARSSSTERKISCRHSRAR